jgi:hypothetical protein
VRIEDDELDHEQDRAGPGGYAADRSSGGRAE